jgi:hypothetical protein
MVVRMVYLFQASTLARLHGNKIVVVVVGKPNTGIGMTIGPRLSSTQNGGKTAREGHEGLFLQKISRSAGEEYAEVNAGAALAAAAGG